MRLLFFEIMALTSFISTTSSAAYLKTQKSPTKLSLMQTTSDTDSELLPWDATFANNLIDEDTFAQTDASQVMVTAE